MTDLTNGQPLQALLYDKPQAMMELVALSNRIASLEAKLKIAVGAFNEIVDWDLESSSDQVERNRKVSLAALKKIGEVK